MVLINLARSWDVDADGLEHAEDEPEPHARRAGDSDDRQAIFQCSS
jgi:hypothetical protein